MQKVSDQKNDSEACFWLASTDASPIFVSICAPNMAAFPEMVPDFNLYYNYGPYSNREPPILTSWNIPINELYLVTSIKSILKIRNCRFQSSTPYLLLE